MHRNPAPQFEGLHFISTAISAGLLGTPITLVASHACLNTN